MHVRRTNQDLGPCLPGVASQLSSGNVLVYLREALGADRTSSLPRMSPLPRPFRLPERSERGLCGFGPGGGWTPFRAGNRAFYLGVYIGPAASTGSRLTVQRLIDGMTIRPR